MIHFLIKDTGLVLYMNKKSHTVSNEHPNFQEIKQLLIDNGSDTDPEAVERLLDVQKSILDYVIKGEGMVLVNDSEIHFKGKPLHNSLTKRILQMKREGFDIQPMILFLENLMQNPSYRSVNQLYDFMEKNDLPITPDGHFLAYKKVVRVGGVLKDIFTRTIVNEPGSVVEVERNEVDEDPNRTCSHGLHFCSREYLPYFGVGPATAVVVVKVNPADVVAIPTDYNNAKVRGCRYEVIEVIEEWENNFKNSVQSRSYDFKGNTQKTEDQYESGYSAGCEKALRHNNNAKGQTIEFGNSDKSVSFNQGYWDGYWDFRNENFKDEVVTMSANRVQKATRSSDKYVRDSRGRFVSTKKPGQNYRRDPYGRFTKS